MNRIVGFLNLNNLRGATAVQPQTAVGSSEAPPAAGQNESLELGSSPAPTPPLPAVRMTPLNLTGQGQQTGLDAMPPEGKVAHLMTSTPGPEPLTPERAGALKHELRVLGELGYLQCGHPDFPKTADHEVAFQLMEKGHPVFWRDTPNSLPVQFTSWQHMEQTAQEARQRTLR